MKCRAAQTRMLELERPDRPGSALRAHLAGCPACQEWFHTFLQMERSVPQLPVPASTGKEQFLRHVLTGEPLPGRNGHAVPRTNFRPDLMRRERGLQKTALATGLAAGLVFLAIGLLALQTTSPIRDNYRRDPLVEKLLKRDLKLASAPSARQRVEELTALADDLRGETQMLAKASADRELETVARLYQKVMQDGIIKHARKIPPGERQQLVGVAEKLEAARREAELLAGAHPQDSAPLQQIAAAAREAESAVRTLTTEGQP